jgi:hypothetical protein
MEKKALVLNQQGLLKEKVEVRAKINEELKAYPFERK